MCSFPLVLRGRAMARGTFRRSRRYTGMSSGRPKSAGIWIHLGDKHFDPLYCDTTESWLIFHTERSYSYAAPGGTVRGCAPQWSHSWWCRSQGCSRQTCSQYVRSDFDSLHQKHRESAGLWVVYVAMDQMVGGRQSPGAIILGCETVYLSRQPSLYGPADWLRTF